MSAYFCWVKSRIGTIEPVIYYGSTPKMDFTSGFKIVQQHLLTQEDYNAVDMDKLLAEPRGALTTLAKRYPKPVLADA